MYTGYIILLSLVLCASPTAGGGKEWKCKHNELKPPELSYAVISPSVDSADGHRTVRSDSYQPIRILVEYDYDLYYSQTYQSTRIKTTIIPKIVDFFQRTLKVKRMTTNILLSRPCNGEVIQLHPYPTCRYSCQDTVKCGEFSVPTSHLAACTVCPSDATDCHTSGTSGTGISGADFVLYVSFTSSMHCNGTTLAHSSHCALEPSLDRPIAGNINFCPLALESEEDDNQIITVAMHELTHTLGFSNLLIPFWRDLNGSPRTARNSSTNLPPTDSDGVFVASESTVMVQRKSWETYNGYKSRSAHFLVTEAVKREAQSHYQCPTSNGLELEFEEGAGSRFSHWEKRLVGNELMSPSLSKSPVLSRLTLAIFEDSGWYQVNYSAADKFRFGQDLGCAFLNESCLTWLKDSSHHTKQPYCLVDVDKVNKSRDCTFDRQSVARCALFRGDTAVDSTFQYFRDPHIQGIPSFSYCPVPVDRGTVEGHDGRCRMSENQPYYRFNKFAEDYSPGSRCINHGTSQSWRVNGKTMSDTGGGCYKYFCTGSGLVVSVLGVNYTCPCEGKEIAFDINYSSINYHVVGSLICPSCKDICWDTPQSCPPQEAAQCYGEVQFTSAITRTSCGDQPFCKHHPGPLCDNLCANNGTCSSNGTCVLTCSPACQNGGTCHTSSSSAHCICPSGYTGSYCQNKELLTATCSPACLNGGTCHSTSYYTHCDCPSGYTGSYCQNRVCSPACRNGGTCNSTSYSAHCNCPRGYTGSYCQNRTCIPACENGGTCHSTSYSADCHCPSGYTGSYCQSRARTCSPACRNGGTCQSTSSSAHCDCPSGHTGSYCQNRACTPACLNGGTCDSTPYSAHCDCRSGYTGTYCQNRTCSPYCQNGGTCHSTSYSAYCSCRSGYTGSYCQNRVCSPACQNGGTCYGSSSYSYCSCRSGYTGSYCQNRACSPSCRNGGTCHSTSYSAYCSCRSGYTGSYCQNRVCSPACRNGGTCHSTSYSAHCDCPSGYTGSYCETRVTRTCNPRCQNGGTCISGSYYSYCACPYGYSGSYCQYNMYRTCSPGCQNGGTCIRGYYPYCSCPYGYTGTYCQHYMYGTCNPGCQNGGTCIRGYYPYCSCPYGYTGTYCQHYIYGPCNPDCQNGGTCIRGYYPYCSCPYGFSGSKCQYSVFGVTCTPSCRNGGTCLFTSPYDAYCSCASGYKGSYCQNTDLGIPSYLVWVLGAMGLLFFSFCICVGIAAIIVPIVILRKKLRDEPNPRNSQNASWGAEGVRIGTQTTGGTTANPRYAYVPLEDMSMINADANTVGEDAPLIDEEEEGEVEDNHHDNEADHDPGMNPMPVETDDEQPLLPN